jgi:hypothetical protein
MARGPAEAGLCLSLKQSSGPLKPKSFAKQHSYLAVPVLLGMIACWQIYRAHFEHLSPWKGGGFGMFSTVDSPGNRFFHCKLIRDAQGREGRTVEAHAVQLPKMDRHRDVLNALRAMPNERDLRALAEELSALRWTNTSPPSPDNASSERQRIMVFKKKDDEPAGARRFKFDKVNLELRTLAWSWSDLRVTPKTLLSVTVDVVKDGKG